MPHISETQQARTWKHICIQSWQVLDQIIDPTRSVLFTQTGSSSFHLKTFNRSWWGMNVSCCMQKGAELWPLPKLWSQLSFAPWVWAPISCSCASSIAVQVTTQTATKPASGPWDSPWQSVVATALASFLLSLRLLLLQDNSAFLILALVL